MKRLLLLTLILGLTGSDSIEAATIYESSTLGPTGVLRTEIANGTVSGSNVSGAVFLGVKFFVEQPVITTRIGGHFIKNTGVDESFFGAIAKLDGESDFPNSADLSTPDIVGDTLLAFPESSDEVFGNLSVYLDRGWYAVVFGSGLFGATGNGGALRNNVDIGMPRYIGFQPGFGWGNYNPNMHFVVEGTIVPEPATSTLVLLAAFFPTHLSLFRVEL